MILIPEFFGAPLSFAPEAPCPPTLVWGLLSDNYKNVTVALLLPGPGPRAQV